MPKESVADKRRREFAEECAITLGIQPEENGDLLKYADDPVGFIEKELKELLTEKQKEIARSVRDSRETNVQACHGADKSHLASRLSIWWILCVGGLVITTAPTDRQVEQILWAEIRRIHGKLKVIGFAFVICDTKMV